MSIALATSIESGQPAYLYSLTRIYAVGLQTSIYHLHIPKIDNGQFHKWKLDKSIKEIQQFKG
jgi:hypothetical protein